MSTVSKWSVTMKKQIKIKVKKNNGTVVPPDGYVVPPDGYVVPPDGY
jgi:hypothetical protein